MFSPLVRLTVMALLLSSEGSCRLHAVAAVFVWRKRQNSRAIINKIKEESQPLCIRPTWLHPVKLLIHKYNLSVNVCIDLPGMKRLIVAST